MLPFLEVEHLPSSSSFYSAIIQPLGLRYLSTEDRHFPSITYGDPSRSAPVFQIRQVVSSRDRPLRTSRIVLSAPSPAAADDAYEFALRANPDVSRDAHPRHFSDGFAAASGASARRTATSGGETRVLITDFDGNLMEIVYQPPADYPSNYRGSTVRYTRSTTDEASRILDWNYDVAFSSRPSPAGPGSASGASPRTVSRRPYSRYSEDGDEPKPGLRRSVTAGSSVYEPATSARENSNGLSAGAVVGTLLGVAAGAALGGAFTYNVFKSEKSRAPREEADMSSFARRSTFPSKYDGYSGRKTRYVDVEREVEKVWYQSDYPAPSDYRRPPPEYIARYSIVDAPRSRDADDRYDDARGRQPFSRSRASSARPRSESASYREPYGGGEAEHRSYASSRSSRHPPIVQRSYTYDSPDRDTYVSARSRRSSSTVRAPPPPPAADPFAPLPHVSSHSRSASRVITTTTTTTTIKGGGSPRVYSREGSYISARNVPLPESRAPTYISARDVPLPPSRPSTYVSARHVPLPDSRVGSSHARWDDAVGDDVDDDADSIAPSDSISCVGSRRSGRSRY
ncbi:ce25f253-51b4-478f-899b-f205eb95544d [Thermothielavioides terrestris]|uniref:VOC domain-containing protein n=2 Tax=Thermothielavioides terrestris TaxID=2587410 RepID=G2R757_THETT|nr:uncharacterized protein THITE_2116797 [Thermothielavioides terrestris NRRL 8126]AEO67766.1 hypothetical protein THITE_2116797 [Thermothielavioides terrestris NRRL 8126]SPQ25893.1 ce25f253-51b4-478f-899b-f205eb95544d [Thermothielavioides terrestris]